MNNTNFQPAPNRSKHHRGLRIPIVEERVGFSKGHIYKLISQGEFPEPYKLSDRVSVWSEAEIDAWLEAKFTRSKYHDASPEPIDQLGLNGGPPLDDAFTPSNSPVIEVGIKNRGGQNG